MASVHKDMRKNAQGKKVWTGKWRVAFRDPNNVQRTRTFNSAADAKAFLSDNEVKMRKGEWVDPTKGRKTFGAFASDWMDAKERNGSLRPNTFALYTYLLDKHILPTFKNMPLRNVTTQAVHDWLTALRMKPSSNGDGKLSTATVAKAYRLMRQLMDHAVRSGYIHANPCMEVNGGAERSKRRELLTESQVEALAEAVSKERPQYEALILLAGLVGLRWGEAVALKRRHVDLLNECVHVVEQVTEVEGRRVEVTDDLKTDAGRRVVFLRAKVLRALRAHLETHVAPEPDALLFPAPRPVGKKAKNQGDRYLRRSNFRKLVWLPATEKVGVAGTHFHDLRHAAATMVAQNGATTAELMAHMGHASPAAALRYQHAETERMRALARRMDAETLATGTDNVIPLR